MGPLFTFTNFKLDNIKTLQLYNLTFVQLYKCTTVLHLYWNTVKLVKAALISVHNTVQGYFI